MESIPGNLRKLVVLAGENPINRPRSKRAVGIYHEYGRLPIVLTGSHAGSNGLVRQQGMKSIAEQMREFMLANDVVEGDLALETKSMDTIANFYYAREDGLVEPGNGLVGVVTDPRHLKRSLWLAKKIYSLSALFTGIASESEYGFGMSVQEAILRTALRLDLRDILEGDLDAFTEYMQNVHPFHSYEYHNDLGFKPEFSWYGLLAGGAAKAGINLRPKEKFGHFEKRK